MKKILLSLFLIVASMQVSNLSAYCTYNRSKNEKIIMKIYPSKSKSEISPLFNRKARHVLKPGGEGCWNWKKIDPKNRKKEWYWVAFVERETESGFDVISPIGEGYFPIGGAIVFKGFNENARAKFNIYYDSKTWKYRKSPWNHKSRPWIEKYKKRQF